MGPPIQASSSGYFVELGELQPTVRILRWNAAASPKGCEIHGNLRSGFAAVSPYRWPSAGTWSRSYCPCLHGWHWCQTVAKDFSYGWAVCHQNHQDDEMSHPTPTVGRAAAEGAQWLKPRTTLVSEELVELSAHAERFPSRVVPVIQPCWLCWWCDGGTDDQETELSWWQAPDPGSWFLRCPTWGESDKAAQPMDLPYWAFTGWGGGTLKPYRRYTRLY